MPRLARRRGSQHRGAPRRSLRVALAMLILGTGLAASVGTPSAGAASPAVVVPAATCAAFDPNIGSGACLKYQSASGVGYTWIGTYRASNGAWFYCIDYLYDSRISATASRVSTANLRNQLNRAIGGAEVAALNYLISTRAPTGTAGSPNGNAAIALIIREVMGDGIRSDGTVVYPPGLTVHGTVKPLPGGMPSAILSLAQSWWTDASQSRGPWTVRLTPKSAAGNVPLGQPVTYQVSVVSADARVVSGVGVTLTCSGPITCPAKLTTTTAPSTITVTSQALGTFAITASVNGPSAQGQLLQGPWSTHSGTTARNNGVQRGWVAQRVNASAAARGTAQIVKATPAVVTEAQAGARPGAALTDQVTVSGLPSGYDHPMTATLYGPFAAPPTSSSCTTDRTAGSVTMPVQANGTFRTPSVVAADPGYYVWTESLPGDDQTTGVDTPCGAAQETTLVKSEPTLSTRVAGSKAAEGTVLSDDITLSDMPEGNAAVSWSLLGPIAPMAGGCAGLDWHNAPIVASGDVAVTGDGQYVTADSAVKRSGCYTYVEKLASSATTDAVETQPGEAAETVLILDWPALHTMASAQRVSVPGSVFDTITVSGLSSGSIDIGWSLLGPLAPGVDGCSGLNWAAAPVRATGHLSAGNGSARTPDVGISVAGCYTFREHSSSTITAAESDSPPGLPAETMLATRSPLRVVPEIPTGPVESRLGWWLDVVALWA